MTEAQRTLRRPADPLADPVFAERYRAMQARDARFDGQFITGVHSTGIYCRPSCPAVTPKPSNVSFYLTAAAAHEAGLRACKRCLPDAVPGSPEWNLRDDLAARAMRLIADGVVEREGVPGLAARLGYTPRHLTRVLTAELGAGPLALVACTPRADGAHAAHGDVAARGRRRVRGGVRQHPAVQRHDPRGLRAQSARAPGRCALRERERRPARRARSSVRVRAGPRPARWRRRHGRGGRSGRGAAPAAGQAAVRFRRRLRLARGPSPRRRRGCGRRPVRAHRCGCPAGPPSWPSRRTATTRRPPSRSRRGSRRSPISRRSSLGCAGSSTSMPTRSRSTPRSAPTRRSRHPSPRRPASACPAASIRTSSSSARSSASRSRSKAARTALARLAFELGERMPRADDGPPCCSRRPARSPRDGEAVLRGPAARVRTIVDVARRLDSGALVRRTRARTP